MRRDRNPLRCATLGCDETPPTERTGPVFNPQPIREGLRLKPDRVMEIVARERRARRSREFVANLASGRSYVVARDRGSVAIVRDGTADDRNRREFFAVGRLEHDAPTDFQPFLLHPDERDKIQPSPASVASIGRAPHS